MVSDVRPMVRQRRSLELLARSKPPTCTFREDVQGVAKELLEARSNDQSVDPPPDPNVSIPIHLLIADTLCGWSMASPLSETWQSSVPVKKSNCLSYQNGENTSANSDADLLGAEPNHGFHMKRKPRRNESLEKLSNPRRVVRQTPSVAEFSWKACIDEKSCCYRPNNREYLQWKVSAKLQLQERLEKQSATDRVGHRNSVSDGSTISKPDATNQLTEHVVEAETRQVENLPEVLIFNQGSSEGPRLRWGETFAPRTFEDETKFISGQGLLIGELRVTTLKGHGGLPYERPSLPSISSQPRFSHPSLSSLQRRLEFQTLSVEGVQVPETQRRWNSSGEEAGGGKQTLDWFHEEEEDGEEEEEEMRNSESEEDDDLELNDSNPHDSRVGFDRNSIKNRMEYRNGYNGIDEDEGKSTQPDSELDQSPSTESHEEDDTNSSISRKPNEKQELRRVSPDRLRFQNLDKDVEHQTKEELTGVLTISGIFPPVGTGNSSRSSSGDTSGSEFPDAHNLEMKRSEGTCEDLDTPSGDPSVPIELKLQAETLRLDFRRNPSEDRPNQPRKLLRLRDVRGAKPRRSTSPADRSRNLVEIACAKVVGVTFGGQTDHMTPPPHGDVFVEMTSPCGIDDGIVVVTSSSAAFKQYKVIKCSSQPNCRGFLNGFRPQPIGAPQRTRTAATDSPGDASTQEGRLPLITGTRLQRL